MSYLKIIEIFPDLHVDKMSYPGIVKYIISDKSTGKKIVTLIAPANISEESEYIELMEAIKEIKSGYY